MTVIGTVPETDPRVEPRVGEVDEQVDHAEDDHDHERQPEDHREVTRVTESDDLRPQPGPGEHGLGEHGGADRGAEVDADERDRPGSWRCAARGGG